MEASLVTIHDYECLPEQPANLNLPLYKHQLASLKRCYAMEDSEIIETTSCGKFNFKIGYLADPVGSGKSFVILGLICSKPVLTGRTNYFTTSNVIEGYYSMKYEFKDKLSEHSNILNVDSNLLILPHGLVKQWSNNIRQYAPSLKFTIIEGKNLKKIDRLDKQQLQAFFDELITNVIIIVKDTIVKEFKNLLSEIQKEVIKKGILFSRTIIDEVDTIKKEIDVLDYGESCPKFNYETGKVSYHSFVIKSEFWWFVSSSISNICNSNAKFVNTLTCNLSYQQINPFKYITIKNSNEVIQKSFKLPPINDKSIICRRLHNIKNILSGFISSDIIDMINADSMDEAMKKLGETCQITDEPNIVALITKKIQVEIHNKKIELEFAEKKIYSSANAKEESINRINKSIQECEKKIALIEERINGENICNICFDTPDNKVILNCCQHLFCLNCILKWLNQNPSCAYCRAKLQDKDIIVVDQKAKKQCEKKKKAELPTKMEELMKLVSNQDQKKILIFANYDGSFNKIMEEFKKTSINFSLLKGTSQHINKVIDQYKTGDTNIILLNGQHFGSGFNLENTTDIILYHTMPADIEMQAIGRGQRFGRTQPLNVWRLKYEDE